MAISRGWNRENSEKAAEAEEQEDALMRAAALIRGIVYAAGFTFFWGWIVAAMRPLDHRFGFSIPPLLHAAGPVILIPSAALCLWCISAFAFVGKGTPAPFDAPRQFVAAGPYRYVRNPMYIGALLVLAGGALWLQSVSALLVGAIFMLMAHLFILFYEEPTLMRRFGQSYAGYKQRVNRWIPGRPSKQSESSAKV